MSEGIRHLPKLAFGDERGVLQQDLNAYRDRLADVITGLSELESTEAGAFQSKSCGVEINGLRLLANSRTALYARTSKPSELMATWVLSGRGHFVFEGRRFDFQPGSIVYLPPDLRKAWSGPCSMVNMALGQPRLLQAYQAIAGEPPHARLLARLSQLRSGPGPAGDRMMEHVCAISRAIDMSLDNTRALEVLGLDQVLYRLVAASVWPELLSDQPADRGPLDLRERATLSKLRDYIHANLDQPLQLTSLAILGGTSTRRVREMFLKAFGVAPADYIPDARLVQARHLLETAPDKRIRDITFELGFTRASSFAAQYRERFGEPPLTTRSRAEGRRLG